MQNQVCTFYDQTAEFAVDDDGEVSVQDYVNSKYQNSNKQIEQRKSVAPYGLMEQPLETFTKNLQKQLCELNTVRTEIDKANFEATIEKDFIDSDLLLALK